MMMRATHKLTCVLHYKLRNEARGSLSVVKSSSKAIALLYRAIAQHCPNPLLHLRDPRTPSLTV